MGSHSRCSPHRCPQHSAREFTSISACAAQLTSPSPSAVANPTDLVKGLSASSHRASAPDLKNSANGTVRMQVHYPAGSPYRSTRHAFASVWREGGLRALYRGTDATTLRGVVLSVSQICAYDQLKQTLKRRGVMQESLALHFTASMFAGFICSVTSNPVGSCAP